MRYIRFVFFFLVLVFYQNVQGQRTHSFSAGVGVSYYYGDLTDKFNNVYVRPSFNFTYSYYVAKTLSVRAGLMITKVGAADSLANESDRLVRNLHFQSPLTELNGVLVWEILPDKNFDRSYRRNKKFFTPYVFGGIALFFFNPRAKYMGEWYKLQPLGTEGQYINEGPENYPDPYALVQVSIPFGGGLNVRFHDQIGLNVEVGYRKTFTDYIDDVSTKYPDLEALQAASGDIAVALSDRSILGFNTGEIRGNDGAKDSYFSLSACLVFYLTGIGK
jgi:hypothetical protein